MQTESDVLIFIAIGLGVIAAIVFFKTKGKKSLGVPPPVSSRSLGATVDVQKAILPHLVRQSANRDVILEGEPPELVNAVESAMTVSLVLLMAHGYRRNPSYFPNAWRL